MARRQVTFLITANAQQFKKTLTSAQYKLKAFGRNTEQLGRSVATLAAPLAIAGAASVKMASDFQSSMTKIQTLVGLSAESVQGMRKDVLDLAKQTGRGPKELSDALFTVTSAGLRGAQAMNTLERAAKASAIGLGDTKDIARALTGILQSYSKQGLTAADATDTLIGVVREGNLEASELAPVLGRVTGIASQLGISFKQVGASIASFTRLGVSSEEAVTGLRGIMNALLKQTPKAAKALSSVGLTFDSLRNKIKKQGLAQALVDLTRRFKGNEQGLAAFAGRVRGLAAIMGTAGAQTESYLRIAKNLENTTGNLDEGFATVSKTIQFKFQKAFANLKVESTKLGTVLFPMAIKLIDYISSWVKWFGSLSDETKKSIFRWTKWTAIIGGSLLVIGKLSLGISGLIGFVKGLTIAIPALITGFQSIGAAAALAAEEGIWAAVTALTAFEGLLVATGIGAIIAGLTALGVHAYKSYQQTQKLHNVLENLDKASLDTINKSIEEVQKKLTRNIGFGLLDKILGNTAHFKSELDALIKKKRELIKAPQISQYIAKPSGQFLNDNGLSVLDNVLPKNQGPLIFHPKVKIEPEIEGGGAGLKTTSIFEDLKKQIEVFKIKADLTDVFPGFDLLKEKTNAIRIALSQAISQGITPASAAFQKFANKIKNPFKDVENPIKRVKLSADQLNTSFGTLSQDFSGDISKMKAASNGLTLIEAAFGRTKDKAIELGQAVQTALQDAFVSFGETLGNVFTGDAGVSGFFNNILIVVTDFMSQFGKLMIAFGTAKAALSFSVDPFTAIAAGIALVAAATAARNLLKKGPGGAETSVNDALIRSDGSIVNFHPRDNILAMKDFSNLIPSMPGMGDRMPAMGGFGGERNIHITGEFKQRGTDLVAVIDSTNIKTLR